MPSHYKIPTIGDIPAVFNIDTVQNTENQGNVGSSKAVGEPPLLLGVSVWTAVKNALSYARPGSVPTLDLPATNEQILLRLSEH
jgi:xanthine dehydrogenase large subunit